MRIEHFHDENGNAQCLHVGSWVEGDEPSMYDVEKVKENPHHEWICADDFVNIIFEADDNEMQSELKEAKKLTTRLGMMVASLEKKLKKES